MTIHDLAFFRLMPGVAKARPACTMWELRDATGADLVMGAHWGDDYLIVRRIADVEVIKAMLDESGLPYEQVLQLPPSMTWAI